MDMERALGRDPAISRQQEPMPLVPEGSNDFIEDPSELMKDDENFLDVKIVEGELNQGMVDVYMRKENPGKSFNELVTVVSVSFFNHDSRHTDPVIGGKP